MIFTTANRILESARVNTQIRLDNEFNNQTVLNITTLTWNLAEKSPLERDCTFLTTYRNSDVVVIGIQECEDIRPRRNEGRRSIKWRKLQTEGLGKTFIHLTQHKLGGMQIGVFVKKKYSKLIKSIELFEVACGIGNVMANKGAVMVLLRIFNKSVLFVNAHLAAHQNKVNIKKHIYHINKSIGKRKE